MPIRAVIFDVGGVLIRVQDRSARRKWETRLGLPEGELSHIVFGSDVSARAMIGQASDADVWKHLAETLNLDDDQLRDLQTDFWSCEELDLSLARFARALRLRYKTAILSNAMPGARQAIAHKFGLDGTVDQIVISAEEGLKKPDPRIYRITTERLEVAPEEAIFVDDVAENVAAAQAIGMRGVQFKDTPQAIAEVKRYLEE